MFIAGKALGIALLLSSITAAAQTGGKPASSLAAQETKASQAEQKDGSALSDQDSSGWLAPGADPENSLGAPFLRHLAADQQQFWTSPERLDRSSWKTLVPFVGLTGALLASDSWIAKQVPDKPDQLKRSKNVSEIAAFSLIGAGGGAFLWGHLTHNERLQETGLLSGEAAINSTAITYAFKGITQRPRPFEGNGNGSFFQGGGSFPSEHSALAWSIASVVAHEYPGPLTKFLAYSLASTVTLTRVTSKQHFASDALVGSALGWYFGRQIYRAHHDPGLGGAPWGDLLEQENESGRDPSRMGSPYVPLDSWIYPALERMAALGYIQSAYLGMRPWTRMECARMVEEAQESMAYADGESGGAGIHRALADEFALETGRLNGAPNLGVGLDSVYTRTTGISGTPLRDGYHFGQTIVNDYGRPYWSGTNAVVGLSADAEAGPFAFYFRGEYQKAPSIPSFSSSVLQAIAANDSTKPFPNGRDAVDRFSLLEGTVSLKVGNVQLSFGKQTAWLGPGESGPLLFSDNATPFTMLRIDSVKPYEIPGISRLLGPMRSEFFLGQLSGQQWVFANTHLVGPIIDPQPFIHGEKISFKPTANLEFGMGITAQFAGPGLPFTWRNFLRTYYSHKASIAEKPGKRLSAFDLTYRVPGLRNWLTFYLDSLVVDEYSPLGSSRPSLELGVYLPQFPRIPQLELRVEGLRSARTNSEFAPGFVYADRRFRSGYTSDGNLLGSWIGRAGTGGQAWATYSFSPRNSLQLGYRVQRVDKKFLEGGTANDFSITWNQMFPNQVGLNASVQYENWHFPLLAPDQQRNVTASIQLTYWPYWRLK
jgi:membrane-associated phospholipid phosphatase